MAIRKWDDYPQEPSTLGAIEVGKTRPPSPTPPTHVPLGPAPAPVIPEDRLSLEGATALMQQARRRAREEALEDEEE
jgi:hypothetical protein